jgi:lysozyme
MNIERLIEQLKKDEGFSPVTFWDNEQMTIGYGTKAFPGEKLITEQDAEVRLGDRVLEAMKDFMSLYDDCQELINDVRAEALTNMAFNLGKTKLLKFRKMNAAIRRNEWMEAANQARLSNWYMQVGKRSERIVKELATGEKEAV